MLSIRDASFIIAQLIIIRLSFCANDVCGENYILKWDDSSTRENIEVSKLELPVLANGHIALIPNGGSIHMNGVYNGHLDETHRALIPNLGRLYFESSERCLQANGTENMAACSLEMDMKRATFKIIAEFRNGLFVVEHTQFAHRYFDRAIVNEIRILRNSVHAATTDGTGKSIQSITIKKKKENQKYL